MTGIRALFASLTISLVSLFAAGTVQAETTHSWVSTTGSGNTCTRDAPCRMLQAAMDVTRTGGTISVLDSGDFGGLSIGTSVTLRAEGVDAGAVVTTFSGFWVSIYGTDATDVVTLENLKFSGVTAVNFQSSGQLHVVRCFFSNANGAGSYGIGFAPDGPAKLSVTDTVITNEGNGTGGGIVVNPQAGGSAQVALKRVTVNGNAFGIVADGTRSTGGINMTIADSMVANNAKDGILATTPTGGAPIGVMVKNTQTINNAFGIRALGPKVTVRASNSTMTGNGTGLSFGSGGKLLTFWSNEVQANGANGAFSGPVGLQ